MIFIPGNVPSSKNSKIKAKGGIFHSKTVQKYLREMGIKSYSVRKKKVEIFKTRPCLFPFSELRQRFGSGIPPIIVGFHFVRDSRRKADFHNLVQILADLFVAGRVIEDDDMSQFFPVPMAINGVLCSVDKFKPGVYVNFTETMNKPPDINFLY